ncbi:MAG: Ferric iron ABC transporter, ATP-binding protein [uncultured Acidimicrobiales bacterium]|uniref:ABC-type quaternary amine transporter n=1 Tax=uncultured Acidimicrobiales bacterium TaxID=310071 RepID=A0A6J4IAI1_9ACTN|nr:MAG: Ferric iron ABC transporter, ATP-binding protein [uncultured Acidimicrobiales bacterium]
MPAGWRRARDGRVARRRAVRLSPAGRRRADRPTGVDGAPTAAGAGSVEGRDPRNRAIRSNLAGPRWADRPTGVDGGPAPDGAGQVGGRPGGGLEVSGLTVRFGPLAAVREVDLAVGPGEVVCLLGPSGCGKSTLLRAVAGLESAAAGSIRWDGADLVAHPPHQRRFGLMFQDFALFPHLDVAANVGFGLRMQGWPDGEAARRVTQVLELVGMSGAGSRAVGKLSGGEQQRVALARALAPAPRLLLLDEPLGALDRTLRERLLVELAALLDDLGTTALHVTHDQEEAFTIGDRVAVMEAGRIVQVGTPAEVWRAPATPFVARFLGFHVADAVARGGAVTGRFGALRAPGVADGAVLVVLRTDALALDPVAPLAGTVAATSFRGDRVVARVRTVLGDLDVQVEPSLAPAAGDAVGVSIDPRRVVVLPA